MPAAAAAAEAAAAVVLLGEDHVALGRVVKIAGLQRLGGEGGKARVGRWHNDNESTSRRLRAGAEALRSDGP